MCHLFWATRYIYVFAVALLLHNVIVVLNQVEVWRQFHVNSQQNNMTLQLHVRLVLLVLVHLCRHFMWPQA